MALRRTVSPPAIPAFDRPPSSLGADRAGRILRVEKINSPVLGARVWRMLSTPTDLSGRIARRAGASGREFPQRRAFSQLCAAGVQLTFERCPGVGHFDVVAASEADVLAWMQAVRDGTPPSPTC